MFSVVTVTSLAELALPNWFTEHEPLSRVMAKIGLKPANQASEVVAYVFVAAPRTNQRQRRLDHGLKVIVTSAAGDERNDRRPSVECEVDRAGGQPRRMSEE